MLPADTKVEHVQLQKVDAVLTANVANHAGKGMTAAASIAARSSTTTTSRRLRLRRYGKAH